MKTDKMAAPCHVTPSTPQPKDCVSAPKMGLRSPDLHPVQTECCLLGLRVIGLFGTLSWAG